MHELKIGGLEKIEDKGISVIEGTPMWLSGAWIGSSEDGRDKDINGNGGLYDGES